MNEIPELVADCINVEELTMQNGSPVIRGTLLIPADRAFEIIAERVKPLNLVPILRRPRTTSSTPMESHESILRSTTKDELSGIVELHLITVTEPRTPKPWINLILFITTVITTIFAGCILSGVNPISEPKNLLAGIPFSFTLLLILGSHEFGHYFACKKMGVKATLPYFIPVPPPLFLLGTFGAIIRIKSPIQDKRGLVAIGAAGPIVGFILAIPITIIGLRLSEFTELAPSGGQILLGNSLIFWLLTKLFTAPPPPGYDLSLNPVAFAGWVGMFVTALNLIPIGQLDGGHISYALLGKLHKFIALPLIAIMLGLGLYWPGWIFWALLILFLLGLRHPPPLNDITELDEKHKLLGYLALFIFIITFVPIPFRLP